MKIKETSPGELEDVLRIHKLAFTQDDEAELVDLLLKDDSAQPLLSLIALVDGKPAGHVLFTNVKIIGAENVRASILAPLAVSPDYQNKGVGGALIKEGLNRLKKSGTELVFVLGHPGYYPRFGFTPAGTQGYETPHPIPLKDADAWMVKKLTPTKSKGKIKCAKTLDKPEYWKE